MISRIKKFLRAYIRIVQKILITVLLFFLYIVGFGVTYLFSAVFQRQLLRDKHKSGESFWNVAVDYETDLNDGTMQS